MRTGIALTAVAIVIMVLPTWRVTWAMSQTAQRTTRHSWVDPQIIGNGDLLQALTFVLVLGALALELVTLVDAAKARVTRTVLILAGVPAVIQCFLTGQRPVAYVVQLLLGLASLYVVSADPAVQAKIAAKANRR